MVHRRRSPTATRRRTPSPTPEAVRAVRMASRPAGRPDGKRGHPTNRVPAVGQTACDGSDSLTDPLACA